MRISEPEHLIRLPGGPWAVWRWVGVRSAGFPADDVLRLASQPCAAAADEVLELEAAVEAGRANVLRHVRETSGEHALSKVRRQLKAGRLPAPTGIPGIDRALCALRSATAAAAAGRQRFDQLFSTARDGTSQTLRRTAAAPQFREALTWQNHPLLSTCIAPLLRREAVARSSKHRQHEELIASYLHRYCLKNETIGFFGPAGWARFDDSGVALEARPGRQLLSARHVYFEQWAVDLLAKRFSSDEELKNWVVPRPSPVARIQGLTVHQPFQPAAVLTKDEMAVLKACDGILTRHQLAATLCRDGGEPAITRERMDAILEKLQAQRLISLSYDLPLDARPERRLRELLERAEDEGQRLRAMTLLTELEVDRVTVAAAAGDPDKLYWALCDLDGHFTALTGASPSRSPGQMYAGRTLVYEDCRRDIEIQIGPPILAALGPPLTLILTSARWLTWQVGQRWREILPGLFERLCRASGLESAGFVEFYNYALDLLSKEPAFGRFAGDLRQRWAEILSAPEAAHSVRYNASSLGGAVSRAFDAPAPGWPGACYHSPDVMIAGSSPEAINSGDCQFVLGELHMAANTLRGQFLVEQHPRPEDIFRGVDADLPGLRLAPITPKRYAGRATRLFPVFNSERQYFAATTLDSIPQSGGISLPGGSLRVRKSRGALVIESQDNGLQFDLVQSFAGVLTRIVLDHFAILPPCGHTPRVSFDDLVVAREAWRFTRPEIEFAEPASSADRFLAARRWRDLHRMPRWVFVRIPGEVKPVYLDFESPIAVDILARRVRAYKPGSHEAKPVTITEMLPCHGQHWLPDAEGRRYSCELRIVAVDPASAVQPGEGRR